MSTPVSTAIPSFQEVNQRLSLLEQRVDGLCLRLVYDKNWDGVSGISSGSGDTQQGGTQTGNTPSGTQQGTSQGNTSQSGTQQGGTQSGTQQGGSQSGNTPSGNTPTSNTPSGNTPSSNTQDDTDRMNGTFGLINVDEQTTTTTLSIIGTLELKDGKVVSMSAMVGGDFKPTSADNNNFTGVVTRSCWIRPTFDLKENFSRSGVLLVDTSKEQPYYSLKIICYDKPTSHLVTLTLPEDNAWTRGTAQGPFHSLNFSSSQ